MVNIAVTTKLSLHRMFLTKLTDPETTLIAQFNPTQFEEQVSANWNRIAPIGLPHKVLQYAGTDNHKFSMELFFHANDNNEHGQRLEPSVLQNGDAVPFSLAHEIESGTEGNRADLLKNLHGARAWLLSCLYPSGGTDIAQFAPPRVLFVWPNVVSMTCIVTSLSFTHEFFTKAGATRQLRCKIEMEEMREYALLSDDVEFYGTRRPAGKPDDQSNL